MPVSKTIVKKGNGAEVSRGQYVTVHCKGSFQNGVVFWDTKDPMYDVFEFQVGKQQVIKGWDEAIPGMRVGEIATITCGPDTAYGSQGFEAWGERAAILRAGEL
mmetsp:Transcript_29017/g.93464  ORF Transcript_29017/g.93464 Transcript_29017/m.93464 type:complete len:104 (-) Transcript_29017:15-326(-)